MAERKPTCGPQAAPVDSTFDAILFVISLISAIAGGIGVLITVIEKTAELTLLGLTALTGVWISAAAGAVIVIGIIAVFFYQRCASRDGRKECAAGVINALTESFDSVVDSLFPFTAMHPSVDLVVKCNYWHLVETNASFIKCTGHSDPNDRSPILQSFFKSAKVCGAGLGALIGSIVGGAAGILLAVLLLAACAATGPLFILCLIAALFIAAFVALLGAASGGALGREIAEGDTPQAEGDILFVGHYVTLNGNLVAHGDFEGAIVNWFVTEEPDEKAPSLHGPSSESWEFTHRDPDTNLIPDACPPVVL